MSLKAQAGVEGEKVDWKAALKRVSGSGSIQEVCHEVAELACTAQTTKKMNQTCNHIEQPQILILTS